eukprot:4684985-Prymnesium_polylepis.1
MVMCHETESARVCAARHVPLLFCAPAAARAAALQVRALAPPPQHRHRALRRPLHAPDRAPLLLRLHRSVALCVRVAVCLH